MGLNDHPVPSPSAFNPHNLKAMNCITYMYQLLGTIALNIISFFSVGVELYCDPFLGLFLSVDGATLVIKQP